MCEGPRYVLPSPCSSRSVAPRDKRPLVRPDVTADENHSKDQAANAWASLVVMRTVILSSEFRGASGRHEQPQHGVKADAALACQCSGKPLRPVVVIGAGKADSDFLATEHGARAAGRRVLVVDQFALPPA